MSENVVGARKTLSESFDAATIMRRVVWFMRAIDERICREILHAGARRLQYDGSRIMRYRSGGKDSLSDREKDPGYQDRILRSLQRFFGTDDIDRALTLPLPPISHARIFAMQRAVTVVWLEGLWLVRQEVDPDAIVYLDHGGIPNGREGALLFKKHWEASFPSDELPELDADHARLVAQSTDHGAHERSNVRGSVIFPGLVIGPDRTGCPCLYSPNHPPENPLHFS